MKPKKDIDYIAFVRNIKEKIHKAQIKAALKVNEELISLYWSIGKEIFKMQKEKGWGNSILEQVAIDLKREMSGIAGFSRTNLYYMRQFYLFYKEEKEPNVQQLVGQIPWGHHTVILNKISDTREAMFYIQQTILNIWSRDTLVLQIESNLYSRIGKAVTNFSKTLPSVQSDLAKAALKDPYILDFLNLDSQTRERDIEKQLVDNIQKFILELGKGFAFVGKQVEIEINKKTYYIDLLFYHVKLYCYIVIELKMGEFQPEYAGKINFYLSAVDDLMKSEKDNPSIGIILCKKKNKIEVEYALRGISKPIGVSEFKLIEKLPKNLKSSLLTIEDIEKDLNRFPIYDKIIEVKHKKSKALPVAKKKKLKSKKKK